MRPSHPEPETFMSKLLRRTLITSASAMALTFSAAALGWSFTWGSGESVSGDGKLSRDTRALSGFETINVSGHFEVKVRQSATPRVELETDGNLLAYIETKVVEGRNGKTLEIGVKRGYNLNTRQPIRIEVDLAQLRGVGISGSGKVSVEPMKTEQLRLSVAGAGTVLAPQLDAGKLNLSIAGSGDIEAGGKAAEMEVSISGSGDVKARELAAEAVKVSIAGSGDAEVQANKTLKVSIAGSGDVRYRGDARTETSVAGSGSVRKL
jgi:Putative auto-transporter adhesin, head GIN domain